MNKIIRFVGILFLGFSTACGAAQADQKGAKPNPLHAAAGNYVVIGDSDTWFKKTTDQSSDLQIGSEKCLLQAGMTLPLQEAAHLSGTHYAVNTQEILPGCEFTNGFIYAAHVSETSGGGNSGGGGGKGGNAGGNVGAFLDVIAYAEGTDSHYNYSFGYHTFSSYADHPRALYCEGSLCSDAAGRYQFLSTTWDPLRAEAGLSDFSPESQDRAAIQLLQDIGAYSTIANIANFDDFYYALKLCATTWASLPGSPYGQPTHSASELWSIYQNSL